MDRPPSSAEGQLATFGGHATLELLTRVFDSVSNGILVVTAEGVITLANAAIFDLFGWSPADLVGEPIERLIPEHLLEVHREHRTGYVDNPSARPMGHGRLLHARRVDGSMFLTEVALSPTQLDGEMHVIAVVRDITARVDAEEVARHEKALQAVSDDRMRLARDLHDAVIQNLFAAGLVVANVSSTVDPQVAETLSRVVDMLDESIRHLRGAVFELHSRREREGELEKIVVEAERVLGFQPDLEIEGDLDAIPPRLREDLAAVIRESLSNIARHARATQASVAVTIEDTLMVQISDDGVGMGSDDVAGTGLRSITERAERRGGQARFESTPGGGTTVLWRAPLGDRVD